MTTGRALNQGDDPGVLSKFKKLGLLTHMPIFHCDAKLFTLGTFASPNTKIPICWYLLR